MGGGGWGIIIPGFHRLYTLVSLYPEQSTNSRAASLLCRVFRISAVQGTVFAAVLQLPLGSGLRQAKQRSERGRSLTNSCKRNCRDHTHTHTEGETPCEVRESFLSVTFLFVSALSMPGSALFVSVLLKMCCSS